MNYLRMKEVNTLFKMEAYPIMLNIRGKATVVIGGGVIAYKRINNLLKAGAKVTVISPDVHANIKALYIENKISWFQKKFQQQDIKSAFIVIAATNNKMINEKVAATASYHQLINVVDNPELSNFHVPAKLSRGDLTITVATNGASPILAREIRNELGELFDDSYVDYVAFLKKAREKVQKHIIDKTERRELLEQVMDLKYKELIQEQLAFLASLDNE